MIITHTTEEWHATRVQLHFILNDPTETATRKAEAQRILRMRPAVKPAEPQADFFALEYVL